MSVLKQTAAVLVLTGGTVCALAAQELGQVRVEVLAANEAVADAEVVVVVDQEDARHVGSFLRARF